MPQRRHTLTIFLLKVDSDATQALRLPVDAVEYPVSFQDGSVGILYATSGKPTPPKWLGFISPIATGLPKFWANNAPALLLVERDDRTFALCFGHSRGWLKSGSWEEDFGLKVTLNSVDAGRLRSVDRASFDAIGQHSRIQASREADISEFGLDLEQDMLRSVSGKPTDPTLGDRLEGRDSLRVSLKLDPEELPALLTRYYTQSQATTYRDRFPWIDQIGEVKDPAVVNHLNEVLVSRISAGELDGIWLSIPELIDWSTVDGFTYSSKKSAEVHSDVYLPDYLAEVKPTDLDIAFLKRRHVQSVTAENVEISHWTVLRCLYAEIERDAATFILTNGKWYSIGQPFLERVDEAYRTIDQSTLVLPEYFDASEGAYNRRVCAEMSDLFTLMDGKTIVCEGYRDTVEVCDLYGHEKQFVHVKRYTGSSAPMSHLFAQALVSATTFKKSSDFRDQTNSLLPDAFRPVLQTPNTNEYGIVFAIVSKSRNPLRLPFFSRVNLNSTVDRLTDLGYRVAILKIATGQQAVAA